MSIDIRPISVKGVHYSPTTLHRDGERIGLTQGLPSTRWNLRGPCGMVTSRPEEVLSITIADIESARRVIETVVLRTPMLPAPKLSALTGAEVYVKYENLQVTNSFKDRGAFVKLAALTEDERRRGVISMSAGNHAQAVAHHAQRLNIPATIVMPTTTPFVKVKATEAYGAKVVLDGETLSECQDRVAALTAERQLVLVHPYDDPAIIAGQGTIALEMLDEVPALDMLVVPIGGGGLIAGNAIAARAVRENIEIVGVEAALYPSMRNAVTE